MKAKPVKLIYGEGYVDCPISESTHITINIPGPSGKLTLPVITHGTRKDTGCWSWNGNVDAPTLKPSVKTNGGNHIEGEWTCHTWITDGKAIFLNDTTHEHAGKTLDLLDIE